MWHAVIKPMEFVDDLADPNHNIQSASVSNRLIEQNPTRETAKFLHQKMRIACNHRSGRGQLQLRS